MLLAEGRTPSLGRGPGSLGEARIKAALDGVPRVPKGCPVGVFKETVDESSVSRIPE